MQRRAVRWAVGLVLFATLVMAAVAGAQTAGLNIAWWTTDGGGGTSAGGSYTLSGTAGQADAGKMSGGTFTLDGGFWPGAAENYQVFLPVVRR